MTGQQLFKVAPIRSRPLKRGVFSVSLCWLFTKEILLCGFVNGIGGSCVCLSSKTFIVRSYRDKKCAMASFEKGILISYEESRLFPLHFLYNKLYQISHYK